jgi:hypothetical protein
VRALSAVLCLAALVWAGPVRAEEPGRLEERERAVLALNAVRNALRQVEGAPVDPARAHLVEAEALFEQARYAESAARADQAWRLLPAAGGEGTRFRVEVDEAGDTKVSARAGQPVRVEARGVERSVEPGRVVAVTRGEAPSEPKPDVPAPRPPQLSRPSADAVIKLRPDRSGLLGPVKLSWKGAEGARGYSVELVPEAEGEAPRVLETATAALELPRLPPGRYRWTVRALGPEALASDPTEPRSFRLEADTLKLDVRGTGWK